VTSSVYDQTNDAVGSM